MNVSESNNLSRRAFLGGVGVALAAPYIIPGAALGADDGVSANNRINIGIIGTGSQAKGLTENAIRHSDVRIVALCDVDNARLVESKSLVDLYYEDESCAAYRDYRELLAREDIDAVIVATPDHWHALVCVEAARRGKDIYCEKPLAWSLGEGQAIVKAVRENNRVFQVGSMQRSAANFKQACQLVRNGHLGQIREILVSLPNGGHALWVDEFPQPPADMDWEFYVGPAAWAPYHPKRCHWDWRWFMNFGGSQMMDWIGHHGDIAHMAMGWDETGPVEVEGLLWKFPEARNNLYDAPEHYQFRCKYRDNITMTVANAASMPDNFKMCGELGTLFIGERDQWVYVDRGAIKASDERLLKIRFTDNDFRFRLQRNHMTDFLECVRTREECIAPVNAGHRSASIGHLGKLACTLEAGFKWDPDSERITDNPALNGMLTRKYRGDWTLES